MHLTRTAVERLSPKRLDPDYYAPQHLLDEAAINSIGSITLGSTGRLFSGPFGSEVPNSVFAPVGIPLFRVANVGEMEVCESGLANITPDLHERLSASEVRSGDLLLVKASVGEKVCVLPPRIPKANVTQHIIGIRPNGTADIYFVAAMLFGQFGRRQLQRRALGAVVQYLGVEDARSVLLPRLAAPAQDYIGSKIRQAEALRERAQAWTDSAFRVVLGLFPGLNSRGDLPRRSSRIAPDLLVDRLNADAYSTDHLRDAETLRIAGLPLRPLSEFVTAPINNSIRGVTDALATPDGEIPMFRPADISGLWLSPETAPKLPLSFEADHSKSRVFPGDIVLAIAGTIGVAGRVPPTVAYGNVNGSSARLRPSEEIRGYLLVLLNTPLGLRLTTRWAVGAVQKHLNLEDLPGILLPVAPANVREILNDLVSRAEMAYLSQRQLVSAARFLVEALIERKVTEAELVAAAADPAADRALLARLTSAGLDAAGEPLFPDLDALEALLKPGDP